MQNERNNLKAGLFIIVSIVLIIAIIVGIKGVGRLLEPNQKRTVVFELTDDIGGLNKGDEVRVGGLKQGTVEDIDFVENPGGQPRIVVTFTLPKRIDLKPDAKISIQTGVTGASNLNIDNLGVGAAIAKAEPMPTDALHGMQGGFAKIIHTIGELAPELQETVHDVRQTTLPKVNTAFDRFAETGQSATEFVKHIQIKVDPAVERYNGVTDAARGAMQKVNDFLGESGGDFRSTIANLSKATGSLKDKIPAILDKVDSAFGKVQTTLDSTNNALVDIREVATNLREATSGARSILATNRGRIDDMIASLKTTGDNLKAASSEVRRSPWRLLYKPAPNEMANLNLFDSAREFAEGANDMSEAAVALRDALKDPKLDPAAVQKLVDQLDHKFDSFQQVETKLWQQVKE
jgi:phospholipid/cholesterol/gamma-HCH transport system substrate-binding protein